MLFAAAAHAADACRADVISRPKPMEVEKGRPVPIEMEGDEVEAVGQDVITMRGNAQLFRGAQAVFGDKLSYSRSTDELEGEGNVTVYSQYGDRLTADRVELEVETMIGEADNVEYRIGNRQFRHNDPEKTYVRARGNASKVYLEGHDVTRLEDVTYSTCNEGKDDVIVKAKELTLDQGSGRGLAKHITVKFKNVPIFYSPLLAFPINNERKTGFLYPTIGFEEKGGFVVQTPYYLNLAPNYDATLYPRFYANRGVQLGGEFRYKTRASDGLVYGEYMPSDKEFEDQDRSAFTYKHDQEFGQRWDGEIDLNWVSDDEYFDDFSNDIEVSSSTHLPQTVNLGYTGDIWRMDASARAYQTIDPDIPEDDQPYDRLPRIRVNADFPELSNGLQFGLDSELHNFKHDTRLEGWRLDLTPSVEKRFTTVWGYTEPKLAFRAIAYNLDNVQPGQESNPNVALPIFSWDSGIYLERLTKWQERTFVHTLEPRIKYTYIPEKNQDELPVFDTGNINLNNFNNIWRDQRFYGRDRIGDINSVTLGLTSRLFDADNGREWIRGSIGQVFFLQDREVQLPGRDPETESESDFLAELTARLSENLRTYGYMQWDYQESNVRTGKADIVYEGPRTSFDLEYRYVRDSESQIRAHALVPFAGRWTFIFDERYSLEDNENLETSLGLEYNGCCWRARLYGQRRRRSDTTFRDAVIFEFELTGLATIRSGLP